MIYEEQTLEGLRFTGDEIRGVEFADCAFSGCTFESVRLTDCAFLNRGRPRWYTYDDLRFC